MDKRNMTITEVIELTSENFDEVVLKSDVPFLVDFWAPWCGPCKAVAPVFKKLAETCSTVRFGKINTDEQSELSERFSVRGIPTFIVFVEGAEASRKVGVSGLADLHDFIDYYKS